MYYYFKTNPWYVIRWGSLKKVTKHGVDFKSALLTLHSQNYEKVPRTCKHIKNVMNATAHTQ